jgi:hypothetical protein
MVKYDKIDFLGLKETIRVQNGAAELLVPTQLGIRVLSYRLAGGENVMKIWPEQIESRAKNEWQSYGGHRLWHAPEERPRTYEADNAPLEIAEARRDGLYLLQPLDPVSRIRKEALITLHEKTSEVKIKHTVTNLNRWPVTLAAWALTVLKEGGFCAVETPRGEFALLPDRSITLWPYARMNDARVSWGDRVLTLRQDAAAKAPFKLGLYAQKGAAAYILPDVIFKKKFGEGLKGSAQRTVHSPQLKGNAECKMRNAELKDQSETFNFQPSTFNSYPDFGCNFETYTNAEMLECESLSPLKELRYNESLDWDEVWTLAKTPAGLKPDDENAVLRAMEN